jgi:hypothetical protein
MHLSSEGKISIFLALIGLAGAGAIMIAPRHTEIGWSLIAIAAVGCVYLAFNHFSGLGYRDLVRAKWIIGLPSVCFVGFAAWYFWSTSKTELITDEHSKKQLSIPISITQLPEPGYARYSGLYPNFEVPSDERSAKYDPPLLGIRDIYISAISH